MKKFNNIVLNVVIILITMLSISSCQNDDDTQALTAPPIIQKVSASVTDLAGTPSDLSPITLMQANNSVIIHGSGFKSLKKVYFNDFDTYFNPNFVTDTDIIVTIDINTPYVNQSNKLKIVTEYGQAEYNFVVAPPAPILNSFHPINAPDGGQITIYGDFFLNPVVTVGGVNATVVSNTLTQIVATIPTGSQGKKVKVTTISGDDEYSSPVGTAIYDDAFIATNVFTGGSWGSTIDEANQTAGEVVQGSQAIKVTINPWSGYQIDNGPPIYPGATGIRFRMKAKELSTDTGNPQEVKIIFNYNWGMQHPINLTQDWAEYSFTWAEVGLSGPPASLQQLTFFSTPASGQIFYIDDIGYDLD
jgi:hypothetical protein